MLLEHVGEQEAADHIQRAVAETLGAGETRTKDMGGTNSTDEMGKAVEQAMRKSA